MKGLSWDGSKSPEELVESAMSRNNSFVGIVDHDTVGPSFLAKEYNAKRGYPIEVITGAEISTNEGHILGLNMQNNVPYWMSIEDTIRELHQQGALAVAAHPLYRLTTSVGKDVLRRVAQDTDPDIYWDGVEVFNAGANSARVGEWMCKWSDGNRRVRRFYTIEGKDGLYGAATGRSDSHGV